MRGGEPDELGPGVAAHNEEKGRRGRSMSGVQEGHTRGWLGAAAERPMAQAASAWTLRLKE